MPSYQAVAHALLNRRWLPIPEGLDANGYPKRPLVKEWPHLECTPEAIDTMPWGDAKGIGIVLGPASNNLAVIDIDDVDLAEAVFKALSPSFVHEPWSYEVPIRLVRTIRGRAHLYVQEERPSKTTTFKVEFQGKPVQIELRTQGAQVTAPPTPGYTLIDANGKPYPCENARLAWNDLMVMVESVFGDVFDPLSAMGLDPNGAPGQLSTSGKNTVWASNVPEGERNRTLYLEAHRLREAGVPESEALTILLTRIAQAYAPGFGQQEAEATIRSAYRKGLPIKGINITHDESQLLPS